MESPCHGAGLAALALRDVALSAPCAVVASGQPGYVLYAPVSPSGAAPLALLALEVDSGAAFAAAIGDVAAAYSVSITDLTAATRVFAEGGDAAAGGAVAPAIFSYTILGRTWCVVLAPSSATLDVAVARGQRKVLAIGAPLAVIGGARC